MAVAVVVVVVAVVAVAAVAVAPVAVAAVAAVAVVAVAVVAVASDPCVSCGKEEPHVPSGVPCKACKALEGPVRPLRAL